MEIASSFVHAVEKDEKYETNFQGGVEFREIIQSAESNSVKEDHPKGEAHHCKSFQIAGGALPQIGVCFVK